MTVRNILSLSAVVLAFAAVGASPAPAATHGEVVRVTAEDFSFALSTKSVERGRVTFVIRNVGHAPHDFAIAGRRSRTISPGQTTQP